MSEQNYVGIKPKRCTECGKDYTPIIHSDECPHNKIGVSEQKRLDRPELREKILSVVGGTCYYLNQPNCPIAGNNACELCNKQVEYLLALIPDCEQRIKEAIDTAIGAYESTCEALIEEAKKQEAKDIIRCINDAKRVHPDWVIDDVIDLLLFREETRQSLQGLEEG